MISWLVGRRCRRGLGAWVVAGGFGFGSSPALGAQTGVEIGPLVGYYRPLGHFAPGSYYYSALPSRPQDLSAPAYGGTATIHFRRRLGIEVAAAAIPNARSSVVFISPGGGGASRESPATVTIASAQLLVDLASDKARRLWIGAGPGFVHHGGAAYADFGSPGTAAFAASVGVDVTLPAHLHAGAGVSALMYGLRLPDPELVGSGTQQDMLLHLGLTWRP